MNMFRITFIAIGIFLFAPQYCHAEWGDIITQTKDQVLKGSLGGAGGSLSDSDIIQGLKEALNIGTENAVGTLSQSDGFLSNRDVKILLPDSVKKAEGLLRAAGYGQTVDNFELSMNRAAEKAVPEATGIFKNAILQMSFEDANKILNGRDNEATLFFKEKTSDDLTGLFKPIVHNAMNEVGVTKNFQDMSQKLEMIPMASSLNLDLDSYVTDKTLDGLFFMIAQEEKKIRENPTARVTDILKKVFAK
ncbi:MAG: DUF4197 domain-containing protein [Desulfobacterales bacterium]|jgi:hypothetical protein|nr:DUF4197 domain-containing protein [Desulfobacterales bacterium]